MRLGRALVDGVAMPGMVADGGFWPLEGDPFAVRESSGARLELADVVLLSPTEPRRALVVLGGFVQPGVAPRAPGELPRFAPKLASTVSGDGGVVLVPPYVEGPVWVEVELAAVVGRELHRASAAEAAAAVAGYTCFNDVTAPQFLRQSTEKDYFSAKSIETFASMGPWIETEITDEDVRRGLAMRVWVNGVLQVDKSTADMKFPVAETLSVASRTVRLFPGDVVSFGTPQWCAVHPGNAVEMEIEGIGRLRNTVAHASS